MNQSSGGDRASGKHGRDARGRIWVSVSFECCRTYQRVYFRAGHRVATGYCPRCLRPVRFELDENGTDARFFTADG